MSKRSSQYKVCFTILVIFFAIFLLVPMVAVFVRALSNGSGVSFEGWSNVFTDRYFWKSMGNSLGISALSAVIAVAVAFIMAYAVNFTNISQGYKKVLSTLAVLPMLLPTITYGFALIYSFGREGLLTRMFGHQIMDVYGMNGMVLGFVIYTMPTAFLLLNNTMGYIDRRYLLVSRLMGDKPARGFYNTVGYPMLGTVATAFIECFTLSFTDYGIPTSIAGNTDMIATYLYNKMMGSIPDFRGGAVVAIAMLLPSIVNILLIQYLKRYNVRYSDTDKMPVGKNRARDWIFGILSTLFLLVIFFTFLSIFIMPFIEQWPYKIHFTWDHFQAVFSDSGLTRIIRNALIFALLTALFGTVAVYFGALLSGRDHPSAVPGKVMDVLALVIQTIPGMVLGIAYLLVFTKTPLHNTMAILILSTIVHLFPTPYLMTKNALEKMNRQWETTAALMHDTWIKTVFRVITPNASGTLLEAFSYYFVNTTVTISAVIFLVSARTSLITTKIKELQHFADFDDIFVLSILLFLINLAMKIIIHAAQSARKRREAKGAARTMEGAAA